jgi:hypothetical protein
MSGLLDPYNPYTLKYIYLDLDTNRSEQIVCVVGLHPSTRDALSVGSWAKSG